MYIVYMYLVGNAINFDDKVILKCNSRKDGIGRLVMWGAIPPDLESHYQMFEFENFIGCVWWTILISHSTPN